MKKIKKKNNTYHRFKIKEKRDIIKMLIKTNNNK